MKLVTKNGYKFVTGLFWQIPDEGKRSINLGKLAKDTKHDMFCQIKTLNSTWGFCRSEELQGAKKVSSLGKFIVEVSKISANYANCIICYKFKKIGELDEYGKELEFDLYGYIVLLNGTICPDDGEYVGSFEMVKDSIIQKAKKHEIETLYLLVDVASQFFSIFEILSDAVFIDKLLIKIMQVITKRQKNELIEFVNTNLNANNTYLELLKNQAEIDLVLLKQLINEPCFAKKLRDIKDKTIKYLISNIQLIAFTSDEIFWQKSKFKNLFNKALIQPISKRLNQKYKIIFLVGLLTSSSYLFYTNFIDKEEVENYKKMQEPLVVQPTAVSPVALIKTCLGDKDKYFRDLGIWSLTSLKCNSLTASFSFTSEVDTNINQFSELIGKGSKRIKLESKIGVYSISYNLNASSTKLNIKAKEYMFDNLQNFAHTFGFQFNLDKRSKNKFNIVSKQSPVFLLTHRVLDNVLLSEIAMSHDKTSGFYTWTLKGEF